MSVRFHVLASGSSGNACVLQAGGFGVLIDFGLSPRQLEPRMRRCRLAWRHIHVVVLTHAHSDHWQQAALARFAKLGLPVYCHDSHVQFFDQESRAFQTLSSGGLINHYEPGRPIRLHAKCECLPFALLHDGAMTCGFRFEGPDWAIGYAADLGSWQPALVKTLLDVDLLALEFNHDVTMQLQSGRHPMLIRRVLGNHGHLSNAQAASLLTEILRRSQPGRMKSLVQLHLSRDCNRPQLAHAAARHALDNLGLDVPIHTAHQDLEGISIDIRSSDMMIMQPMLPFAD